MAGRISSATSTSFSADFVHTDGRDLNVRARLNSRPGGGPRRFADLPLDPNSGNFRVVISPLQSVYDALLLSLRRRSASGIDFALELHDLDGQERAGTGRGRDRPGAEYDPGCDRPVRAGGVRPRGERREASRVSQRDRSSRRADPGGAGVLLPVGPAGLHYRGPRSKRRLHQQRHPGSCVQASTASANRRATSAPAARSTVAAAPEPPSSAFACRDDSPSASRG